MSALSAKKHLGHRLYTLPETAKILGVSYERVRQWVTEGRLRATFVPGIGRVVTSEELDRFRQVPRSPGRPPKREKPSRRMSRHSITTTAELRDRVKARTGEDPTPDQIRALVRLGLLPHRKALPCGEIGRRMCLALRYRRLVALAHLRRHHLTSHRDQAIALKFFKYRPAHDILNRAMISYLYTLWKGCDSLTDDDLERFAFKEGQNESAPFLAPQMSPAQRKDTYAALLRIGLGRAFRSEDMQAARDVLGLPENLLPGQTVASDGPDASWAGLFTQMQVIDEKLVDLAQSSVIDEEQKGERRVILIRPLGTPEELDKAWSVARPILSRVLPLLVGRLKGAPPKLYVFMVNVTIVRMVAHCLILLREQGDKAFFPLTGELAQFNGLIRDVAVSLVAFPPPPEVAPLLGKMLTSPPVTKKERRSTIRALEIMLRNADLNDAGKAAAEELLVIARRPSKKGLAKLARLWQFITAPPKGRASAENAN
jgi:excisionase family DNA binding protein